MRILRVCSAGLYAEQYNECIAKNVPVTSSYEETLRILQDYGMVYPSSFSAHMRAVGVETDDVIPDLPRLQHLWQAQYGHREESIFIQQIRHYHPDVLYFQELDVIPHSVRKSLRAQFPFIKIITGFKGFPPRMFSDYADLDHVFISYPHFQEQWQEVGVKTTILPHCFDPGSLFLQKDHTSKTYDFSFLGSTGFGNQAQSERYYALKELMHTTPLEVWGRENEISIPYYFSKGLALELLHVLPAGMLQEFRNLAHKNHHMNMLMRDALLVKEKKVTPFEWYLFEKPLRKVFSKRVHAPVSGNDYLSLIAGSRISLNRHTDEPWEGGNIRTFEVTGVGTCLLTDDRPNMRQLFSENEVVFYTSVDDCIEKANYLLSHPHEREAIADRGKKRVLSDHTTSKRCERIRQVLESLL